MPLYMTQFSYTADGWRALVKNPHDQVEGLRKLFTKLGGNLLSLHYSFGEYDSLILAEAPDETIMTSVLLSVISDAHVKSTKTTVLMTPDQAVKSMRRAAELE